MLFEDKERSFQGPRPYDEGDWEYLDRSARVEAQRVRHFLNTWTAEYPDNNRAELIARIRSRDRRNFESATFELVVFGLLRSMGCAVTVHPDLPNGNPAHPDFLAITSAGDRMYVEAVLASEHSGAEIAARKRTDVVLAAIDRIQSPNFFIGLNAEGHPETPPNGRKLRQYLEKWVSSLDVDEVAREVAERGTSAIPTRTWERDGWKIEFEAFPKAPERRGQGQRTIGTIFDGMRVVNAWEPIRDAVKAKGNRYGELDQPMLVCVNVDAMVGDHIDDMQGLFGQEGYVFRVGDAAPPQMRRMPNGAWFGPQGPQYKRVSGAWIFHSLNPWNVVSRKNCIYFNPWAEKALFDLLRRANHATAEVDKMTWTDGESLGQILGLPPEWPE